MPKKHFDVKSTMGTARQAVESYRSKTDITETKESKNLAVSKLCFYMPTQTLESLENVRADFKGIGIKEMYVSRIIMFACDYICKQINEQGLDGEFAQALLKTESLKAKYRRKSNSK